MELDSIEEKVLKGLKKFKYGVEVDFLSEELDMDEEEVKKVLEGQKGGEAELSNIGIFENDDYDVVKVDIKSPDLHRLNKQLSDNLENTDEHPVYHPHLTIAYVKSGEGKKYKGSNKLSGKKFSFNKVVFEDSDDNPTTIELD